MDEVVRVPDALVLLGQGFPVGEVALFYLAVEYVSVLDEQVDVGRFPLPELGWCMGTIRVDQAV